LTLVCSLDARLEILCGFFPLPEQFFNARKSATRSSSAGGNSFFGAMEVVPSQGLHVGPEDEVGMTLPDFKLVFLRGAHGAAHNLKDVCRGAAVAILHANGNPNYRGSANVASGARRNRGDQPAIRQTPRANLNWFEQAGEGAACADGIGKISLGEHYGLARGQVRGHNCKRNTEIFKVSRIKNTLDQIFKSLIACQAKPRDTPAGDIPQAERAARLNYARKRGPTGVRSSKDAAHARPRDVRDGDMVLFENLQNAEMRETSCKPSP